MTITAANRKKLEVESITDAEVDERDDIASPEEATKELERIFKENKDLFLKLVHYAQKKIKYVYKGGNINGFTGMDIVQITIEKIIKGKRKWNRKKVPKFTSFLYLATFSDIRNKYKEEKKFITIDMYDTEGKLDENKFPEYLKECYREELKDKALETETERLLEKLQKDLEEDEEAYFVLEESLNGCHSNKETAERLGIDVKEVVNAKRRIKYRTEKLLQ